MEDNTYIFALISAVLKRIGKLLGGDEGEIFIQVSEEIWSYFERHKGDVIPTHPDDFDLTK